MSQKTYIEILITPIVIAVIGIIGTNVISNTQVQNTKEIAEAQIRLQIREAENNKKLKTLEIFGKQIISKNPEERKLALGLISILDQDLADEMLSYLAKYDPDKMVKEEAKNLQKKLQNKAKNLQNEARFLGHDDIEERVKRVIAKNYHVSFSEVKLQSVLEKINPSRNVPGVGDLTSIEVLIELEELYSCHVKDDIAIEIETVKDMVDVFKSCFDRQN
ncbi:hypothetical protein [Pseudoalteromonas sp. M8]|uniref:hypothetical protein n=1 Tax=Pseudoalteromonas sp. M8 TaxID=2692624 RepID=UPI001BAD2570|nr:hypothetical protein [Pseudoalteromonas sp. M8]QUI68492.1 hypothetical protein GSF13_01295 [Pseudoalteromonas sp. M8]